MIPKLAFVRLLRFSGRVWLGGGLVCLLFALMFASRTLAFIHTAIATDGAIVGLAPGRGAHDGEVSYAPIFRFAAVNGHIYTITSRVASNPPSVSPGQAVQVLYERKNPANAKLALFWPLWFLTILLAGIGISLAAAGYTLLLYARRRRQKNGPVHITIGFLDYTISKFKPGSSTGCAMSKLAISEISFPSVKVPSSCGSISVLVIESIADAPVQLW